jgi:hypothetical protein
MAFMSISTLVKLAPLQGAAAQDAKPTLNLVEPATMGGSKMKMHVRMGFKPAGVFGLMGVKIIQHHMEFFTGIVADKLVHEVQKLAPAPFEQTGD